MRRDCSQRSQIYRPVVERARKGSERESLGGGAPVLNCRPFDCQGSCTAELLRGGGRLDQCRLFSCTCREAGSRARAAAPERAGSSSSSTGGGGGGGRRRTAASRRAGVARPAAGLCDVTAARRATGPLAALALTCCSPTRPRRCSCQTPAETQTGRRPRTAGSSCSPASWPTGDGTHPDVHSHNTEGRGQRCRSTLCPI